MATRLFEIVKERAIHRPELPMLAAFDGDKWKTYTAREVWDDALALASGLKKHWQSLAAANLYPSMPKLGIISPNRPEWIITDLAAQMSGAILTPIYPTISATELSYILEESEMDTLFISGPEIWETFKDVLDTHPRLRHLYSFEKTESASNWKSLFDASAQENTILNEAPGERDLATIIYTSGTTGHPKGVMLSHRNIVSNVMDCLPQFWFAEEGDRALSFLPLNHIFEKMVSYVYIQAGVCIYYARSMETIGEDLRSVKPIVFTTVPRLLEKVYERIFNKGLELRGLKRWLFFWALRLGGRFDNINRGSLGYRIQHWLANRLVFSKWREALGGQVKAIVTGSAACQLRLIRLFSAADIVIMEGYGLTETSPVISVNSFRSEDRRMGTVGPVIPGVSVKILDDGEILCRGANVMEGYYKQPELTREAIDDEGWFHTGDIGTWVEGRFLKITDRKKEMFKTSGGKYVAPQVVENKMKESLFIEQIIVLGAGRKFVSALIVPAFGQIQSYFESRRISLPKDPARLVESPEVKALIEAEVNQLNRFFSHPEQIKKFQLLANEWTIDQGELTPTIKIRRSVIEKKHAALIEAMYQESPPDARTSVS